jgi:arylsulfatase A-like enzyme
VSTTADIISADEVPEFEYQPTWLDRVGDFCRIGAPYGVRNRGRHGAILSLVLAVCLFIFIVKSLIAFSELRYEGIGRSGLLGPNGLVIFDPDLPLWISIPTCLGKTWLCCAEDFAVAAAVLLLATLALKYLPFMQRREGGGSTLLRLAFWALVYIAAYAAMMLMVVNLFLYLGVDRFANFKMLLTWHPLMMHSVKSDTTIARQIAIFVMPLAVLAFQLFLITLLPSLWQRCAYLICRPLMLVAGLVFFIALAGFSRFMLGEDHGGFQHNAYLWALVNNEPKADADFLPGFPQLGHPELAHRPKNLIIIVGESLGHNCMHIYHAPVYKPLFGDETCPWQTTPNLEQIVEHEKKGVVFENSYAISDHTIVSALALFGSMNNHNTDNSTIYASRDYIGPDGRKDFPFPAASRWLQKQGYRTYFCGAGGKFAWEGYKNLGRATLTYGFDIAKDDYRHFGTETPDWPFDRSSKGDKWDMNMFEDAYLCLDDAEAHQQPFYMMLWSFDTHCAYYPNDGPAGDEMPSGWNNFDFWHQGTQYDELVHAAPKDGWDRTRFWPGFLVDTDENRARCQGRSSLDPAWLYDDRDSSGNPIKSEKMDELNRYLNAVSRLDTLIAKLYRDLEKRGLADDTLIIVTGDHGQSWGHHNTWRHGDKLYDEQCRVPMIMINKHLGDWAVEHDFGPRNSELVSGLDVWPSAMDVMGLPCHELWQGKSMFSTEIPPEQRRIYMWVGGPVAGVREGDYKYVWDKEDGKQYLFNMVDDPDELHNLVRDDDQRDRVERMHRQVHMWQGWQTMWNEKMLREGARD